MKRTYAALSKDDIDGMDITSYDKASYLQIHHAAESGDVQVLKRLLEAFPKGALKRLKPKRRKKTDKEETIPSNPPFRQKWSY